MNYPIGYGRLFSDYFITGFFIARFPQWDKANFFLQKIDLPGLEAKTIERHYGFGVKKAFVSHYELNNKTVNITFYMDDRINLLMDIFTTIVNKLHPHKLSSKDGYHDLEIYIYNPEYAKFINLYKDGNITQYQEPLLIFRFVEIYPQNLDFNSILQTDLSNNNISSFDITFQFSHLLVYKNQTLLYSTSFNPSNSERLFYKNANNLFKSDLKDEAEKLYKPEEISVDIK